MSERWLTFDELSLEMRLQRKALRRLIKRGKIVGICHGYKDRLETDWRYLDPSEKYKAALGTLERLLANAYDMDLLATPLLSSADFAAIAGLHPGTIRSLVSRRKLRPFKLGHHSMFTPLQLHEYLLKRERKEPTSRRARCETMIRWCLAELEKQGVETMTEKQAENDDLLERHLRKLLAKREPERSAAVKEFWRRYDLARDVAAILRKE